MSSVIQPLGAAPQMPRPHVNAAGQEAAAAKQGSRRTVYFTKGLGKNPSDGYARTHQYLGEWKDNQWEGKGTLERVDGSRYVGAWVGGKRNGTGTSWQRHKDGSLRKIYAGEWKDDKMHGRGTYNYKNADVYIGEWQNGQRAGVGVCTYADGSYYEGEWLNDQPHGFGVFDYPKGDHFEGHWVEGKKEGKGVHFYYDREKKTHTKRYDGEWVDGHPKCGAYTEMPPDPLAPASSAPDPIPAIELIDAEGVLASRLGEIRAERAKYRAQSISLEEHFTPEELDALKLAFSRVDADELGMLPFDGLLAAFGEVGMSPSEEQLSEVLTGLGKQTDASAMFEFADFAQAADLLSPVDEEE